MSEQGVRTVSVEAPPLPMPQKKSLLRPGGLMASPLVLVCLSGVTILLLWQVGVAVFQPRAFIFPSPSLVFEQLWDARTSLGEHSLYTVINVLVGFGISMAIGVPVGIVLGLSKVLERLIYPPLVASQAIPKVALAPLFLVWFGAGIAPKIWMAVSIAIFPIVINTVVGVRAIDPDMVRLARATGGGWYRTIRKLRLPIALPAIFAGAKLGVTLSLIGVVVAEFQAGDQGLGYVISVASGSLETAYSFAGLIILAVISMVLFMLVELVERIAMPWRKHSL